MRTYKTPTDTPLRVYGSPLIDKKTIEQARALTAHPLVKGVALMPDAHVGIGATVGCVSHLVGGIIPSVVGVDVGCGVAAHGLGLFATQVPTSVRKRVAEIIRETVPSGVGQAHDDEQEIVGPMPLPTPRVAGMIELARKQFGTLGAGNHFFEVSVSTTGHLWVLVHSGSRGIGNKLATFHMARAAALNPYADDPALGWYEVGTTEYDEYIEDMTWLQNYAYFSRLTMLRRVQSRLAATLQDDRWVREWSTINCHHNYATLDIPGEHIVRKGAISAAKGVWGVIPGSMGASTYIVRGKGAPQAYSSAPHGAGRAMARGEARRSLDVAEFKAQMGDRVWQDRDAEGLLDEAPNAYKDVGAVMKAAAPLVKVTDVLTAIVNYKGV